MRLPGEFEPVDEVLVAWSGDMQMFFLDLVASAADHAAVTIAVGPDESVAEVEAVLADFGISSADAQVVAMPIDTMWVRDFGPIVVQDAQGDRSVVDLRYLGSQHDEAFATVAAQQLWDLPSRADDLKLDGGNLLSDGAGRCVTTGPVLDPALAADSASEFRERAHMLFGCRELVVLPRLFGEETGHIDMYVALPGQGRALVGSYATWQDEDNAALLDDAAAQLVAAGFDVTRVPMGYNADGVYRSYTNLVALNDAVLVPVYPEQPHGEHGALVAIASAYPDREIIPVMATDPIQLGGALHCATIALPAP
jgi:agmatine/peptidylarginine deiminase